MRGVYTLVVEVKTNSDNVPDLQNSVVTALLEKTSTIREIVSVHVKECE